MTHNIILVDFLLSTDSKIDNSHFWVGRQGLALGRQGLALFHKLLSLLFQHKGALWRLPEKNSGVSIIWHKINRALSIFNKNLCNVQNQQKVAHLTKWQNDISLFVLLYVCKSHLAWRTQADWCLCLKSQTRCSQWKHFTWRIIVVNFAGNLYKSPGQQSSQWENGRTRPPPTL